MPVLLADHTTLGVGGPAGTFLRATSDAELVDAVRELPDAVILGGGSNVVVCDAGLDCVVLVNTKGIAIDESDSWVSVTAAAGESWDELVGLSVERGWSGIEAMTGIPGLVGAAPMQNIGAYGQDLAQVCERVRAFDRERNEYVVLSRQECEFAYRSSLFKREPSRFVIVSVTLTLKTSGNSPVRYDQLATLLGVEVGESAPSRDIAHAVRALRAEKGMLLDRADRDTWSTGSFFTNPIVDGAFTVPEACPRYPAEQGMKLSAAWLIEQAGITKGWGLNDRATVSTKHTLALTNRGDASAADIVELAGAITDRVHDAFGVELEPEPVLLGFGE